MTPEELLAAHGPREAMEYDVVIVGGGPAGLAAGIRLKQLAAQSGTELSVVLLEKGSEPGAHILSGAVMDPRALTELLPNWKADGAPLLQPVTSDQLLMLSATRGYVTPQFLTPECFHNEGSYIVSLGSVVRWMAQQADLPKDGVPMLASCAGVPCSMPSAYHRKTQFLKKRLVPWSAPMQHA